jgi:hypothetical protein
MKTKLLFTLSLILTASAIFAQVDLNNGLVAFYKFDGNVADSSTNGLNGMLTGASYDSGHFDKPNSALKFNGSSDYVSVANNSKLSITGDKSISVWFKIPSASGLNFYPSLVYKQGQGDFSNYAIFLAEESSYGVNRYKIGFQQGGNNTNKDVFTKEKYTDHVSEWINIIGTYSSSDNLMRIYFNGKLSDSLSVPGLSGYTSNDDLQIGRGNKANFSANYFKGYIDDVRIYNRTLNGAEVVALQDDGKPLNIFTPKKMSKQFTVYPNPSNGELTIYSSFFFDKNIQVNITDIQGKTVYSSEIKNGALLNLSHLTGGAYIVEIVYNNSIERHKTLIK